jgi:2-hydroxychromene-2-carboxylate isomerase
MGTPRDVIVYVDFRSPFSFLAKDEAFALEKEFAINLQWRPFHVDLEGAYGGTVEQRPDIGWRKVRYLYMDARRLANRRGLIVRGTVKIFDPTVAHAAMLYALDRGVFRAFHDRAGERFWRRDLDIENPALVEAALAEAGADVAGFADYLCHQAPARLAAIMAEAEAAGVFGVPTFVLDGELFWGTDRIWLLRERLAAAR